VRLLTALRCCDSTSAPGGISAADQLLVHWVTQWDSCRCHLCPAKSKLYAAASNA
jgi:hypothetical protein